MILESNKYGRLSMPELTDFELVNDIKLPTDYQEFLLKFNGGEPSPNENPSPETVVRYILGMHNGDKFASLYRFIEIYAKRLPGGCMPIATDPFGNLFIMNLNAEDLGYIYFWDHEGEPEVQDGHYVDNCYFVAYSFTEFLNNLR